MTDEKDTRSHTLPILAQTNSLDRCPNTAMGVIGQGIVQRPPNQREAAQDYHRFRSIPSTSCFLSLLIEIAVKVDPCGQDWHAVAEPIYQCESGY